MKTLQKLQSARKMIKETKVKKEGHNTFSKYDYFTPSQISQLVHQASEEFKLFNKFDLNRTELGLVATLEVYDLETDSDPVSFQIATDIPEIKATNIAQQLGGCVTYSERYLLQIAYDIIDNSLDFDSKDNTTVKAKPEDKVISSVNKKELTPDLEAWKEAIAYLREGHSISEIEKKYKLSAKNKEDLVFASTL